MRDYRLKLYRGRYYATWSENGHTKRTALRTADRAEAERGLADFKRLAVGGKPGATVEEIVAGYLHEKEGHIVDVRRLKDAWRRAKPTFGNLRPDQITRELCRGYTKQRREDGVSDATILKELNVVRQALNYGKVPGAVFEAPSAPPPRDRYLTKPEFKQLLGGCSQPHVRLFLVLAVTTAARKSAILELTWDRVDLERRRIHLSAPTELRRKKRAIVPINDLLLEELQAALEARQTKWVIEYHAKQVGSIKTGFYAAVKRSGLVGVRPHDLRHSAAVWMAEAGIPMSQIAQFLGHSNDRITFRTYARYSPDYLRNAADALDFRDPLPEDDPEDENE